MSTLIRQQEPKSLWNHFSDLNAIPRASKKEEQVIQFMLDFGNELGLETIKDHIGNVIIRKPATSGMEDRETVVLQSHLDMVHQKNNDTDFDFATEGIKMVLNQDWIKADGTTLGADNGIGVAAIMAILTSKDIPHPNIEALFTIDEETGMTGALELKGGILTGGILLNLDTEDDDELTIGCAGGIDITASGHYDEENFQNSCQWSKIEVKGLSGGHSGMDIHKGLGNANKIMNRILSEISLQYEIRVHSINGGGLRNAIPRESVSIIGYNQDYASEIESIVVAAKQMLHTEYNVTDPNIEITMSMADHQDRCVPKAFMDQILKVVYATTNGIYRMSPEISDLVQTSNNLAKVQVENGGYKILCLTRSSVDSEKMDLAKSLRATFELIGSSVEFSGSYPGWTPKPSSNIVDLMRKIYIEMFAEEPHVYACHAGLECGILGTNYPDMEMISFGPNIRGAHSPDEKVQISSVQKFWRYFKETLSRIPIKK